MTARIGNADVQSPFGSLDGTKLSMNHIKIWFTAGMGFFTDAYDLFVIGVALIIFNAYNLPGFDLATTIFGLPAAGFIGASAIFSAIIGQLFFGFLGDRIGRKKIYGVEAVILAAGALLSAFSANLYWLILFRFIQGIGIGGDYPISATIMSEYANAKDRGKLVSLIFANQGIGSVAAVMVGLVSIISLPPDMAWRMAVGVGAIPAIAVIYLRRRVPETPRYSLLVRGNAEEARKAAGMLGTQISDTAVKAREMGVAAFVRKYARLLLITGGTWFLLDVAFYGTGIYSGPIVSSILPISAGLPLQLRLEKEIANAGIPFFVGFFGYFTAVALMDRLGRKLTQLQGFVAMAVLYVAVSSLAVTSGISITGFAVPAALALGLYSLSFFFIDFGPNTTTFVVPAEVYPVNYRSTGHGISAAAGKAGAAITVFFFPSLLSSIGVTGILHMLAVVSIGGAALTLLMKREPKNTTLEEASREELVLAH
ncbi:MAG: MFS transporter [Nitrososphaerota archaeon]|nr:MFS transporter [Nitrososphaerota archaeon]